MDGLDYAVIALKGVDQYMTPATKQTDVTVTDRGDLIIRNHFGWVTFAAAAGEWIAVAVHPAKDENKGDGEKS